MTDAPKLTEAEHAERVLPYLKHMATADPDASQGVDMGLIESGWPYHGDANFQKASQVRQSMYIGKLAEKRDGRLYLTAKGLEMARGK